MRIISLVFVSLLILSLIPIGHSAADTQKIRTIVEGPKEVLTDTEYEYTIRIEGAPDADRWGYSINMTQGSATPSNGSSDNSSEFRVTVKSPAVEGDFTITVNGTADIGNTTYWNRVNYTVHAVKPSTVKVDIYNSGGVNASNVSVSLFIDDKFQYKTSVDVPSGASKNVELKWNPLEFSDGVHRMKIVVDDSSNLTFLNNGKTVLVKEIYIGQIHEDKTTTWLALAILFSAGAFASFLSFRRKKKRLKRRKW